MIIVFDAIQGIKQTELDLYLRLMNLGKPYVVVLNKQDLVKRDIKVVVDHSAKALNLSAEHILPVSARNGENIPNLMKMIAATEPEIIAALGQALPEYRWQLAWRSIASAASVSAAIALTPLPIIDFLPLVVTQSVMVLGIARIYNYKITLKRARELVVSFGIGFLGRSLFYELSKFTGLPGWMLSASIAVSMTVVMGYAAVMWFDRGERLSNENVKQLSREFTKIFVGNIKGILKRKPGKQGMKDAIETMLVNSKFGQDRSVIEQQSEEILLLPTNPEEPRT